MFIKNCFCAFILELCFNKTISLQGTSYHVYIYLNIYTKDPSG